jgi:hypothetical protein
MKIQLKKVVKSLVQKAAVPLALTIGSLAVSPPQCC